MADLWERVVLEEVVDFQDNYTRAYFIAPLDLLYVYWPWNRDLHVEPNTKYCTIYLEHPKNSLNVSDCLVSMSPTCDTGDELFDYDWCDVVVGQREIDTLIELMLRQQRRPYALANARNCM